jgi:hypothetical protein
VMYFVVQAFSRSVQRHECDSDRAWLRRHPDRNGRPPARGPVHCMGPLLPFQERIGTPVEMILGE